MLCTLNCFAETIVVDAFTGEDIEPNGKTSVSLITVGCRYDSKTGLYTLSTSAEENTNVISTVADGMIVRGPVGISCEDNVNVVVYKDGLELQSPNLEEITSPGSYRVFAVDALGNTFRLLDFTIVDSVTNTITTFTAPKSFYILSASRNGEAIAVGDSMLNMEEEGAYVVEYICRPSGVKYTLETTIDRTAPVLALEALNGGYSVSGPVDISDLEPDCAIEIEKDGAPVRYTGMLTDTGVYKITLTDRAGNINVYDFKINLYFNVNTWVVAGLLLVVIIWISADIMNARKKFRVR